MTRRRRWGSRRGRWTGCGRMPARGCCGRWRVDACPIASECGRSSRMRRRSQRASARRSLMAHAERIGRCGWRWSRFWPAAAARPMFLAAPTAGAQMAGPGEGPGTRIGPYKLLEEGRARRLRHGVPGGAGVAGAAAGGAQDHQARDGHAGGDRSIRGGTAGAGDDGPRAHRAGARMQARQRPGVRFS
jgi:hypothetical protein